MNNLAKLITFNSIVIVIIITVMSMININAHIESKERDEEIMKKLDNVASACYIDSNVNPFKR